MIMLVIGEEKQISLTSWDNLRMNDILYFRQGYCGECAAEYHIKGSWVTCPVTTTDAKGM